MYRIKKIITLLVIVKCTALFPQQNYFNVPSSQITKVKKVFVQEQLNVAGYGLQSNLTFCYGLPKNFEVGFNVLNLDFKEANKRMVFAKNNDIFQGPVSPEVFFNVQKGFQINKYLEIGSGLQLGVPYLFQNNFDTYAYTNLDYVSETTGLKMTGGLYYANNNYLGSDSLTGSTLVRNSGIQFGIEKFILPKKISVMADHMTGTHALGQSVIGIACYLPHHFILSLGAQIANYKSRALNGFVFELTIEP